MVSTHKFYSSFKSEIDFTGSLDDMVEIFLEGKTYFGPWWEHVNHYSQLENVHIIHYEDLLEVQCILCSFCGDLIHIAIY